MKRLAARFAATRAGNRAALICYVTAGDPSLKITRDLVVRLAESGADIVELGIPFSDPMADGPTIQQSSQRALAAGATLERVLACVEDIRRRSDVPLVAMTYCNPVERYGIEQFARDARSAGFDGVILTDMPPEEAGAWRTLARAHDLDTVFLAAPTSTAERLRAAARASSGFLYCVSRLGVTGVRKELPVELADLIERARAVARCPVCVGFGISTPDHVRAVARLADGVIVGSALVSIIARGGSSSHVIAQATDLVRELASATWRSTE